MNASLTTWWLLGHALAMVGAFGGVLVIQAGLPASARADTALLRPASRLINILLVAGLGFGLLAYSSLIRAAKAAGEELTPTLHAVIGTKFLLLFAIGALLGIASAMTRKGAHGPANALRWSAVVLFAVAAFLGLSIRG